MMISQNVRKLPNNARTFAAVGNETPSSVEARMRINLEKRFHPEHLVIVNESHMHNTGDKNAETHFKIIVVSNIFQNVAILDRHRMVHEVIGDELKKSVHALCIDVKTPSQWYETQQKIPRTPNCKGGFGL